MVLHLVECPRYIIWTEVLGRLHITPTEDMETNAMKLQALSFSADVNAGGDLEQAECFNPAL